MNIHFSVLQKFLPAFTTRYRSALTACVVVLSFFPGLARAHQNPSTLVILDVSPGKTVMELQLPLSELELAYGHGISKHPETAVLRERQQLEQYLLAHIHSTTAEGKPWRISITDMKVEKAVQMVSGPPFQEITVHLDLLPPPGADPRRFILHYDLIMHQVVTHSALVSVRNDWETGKNGEQVAEVGSIRVDTKTTRIYPMKINLEKGSWFAGFKSMVGLGIQHIKEGTDHLLFLLVLLLPATLLVNGKRWGGFGGTRYSILKLVKTTTAFTMGHSLTLLLGALQWVQLPSQPVEVLIAVSILVSAIHAVRPLFPGKEGWVAGGFGLVHGLAFASVLSAMHLAAGPMALSILGFNLGIELMQLFVILLVIPWTIILSESPAYKIVRVTAAGFAGIAALAWMAERVSGTQNAIGSSVLQGAKYGYVAIFVLAGITVFVFLTQRSKIGKLSS